MDKTFYEDLLKKGSVGGWNKWRDDNPKTTPNLSKIDLRDRNLSNINFQGVSLKAANLVRCNFRGANLENSDLTSANLLFSVFERTNLSNSIFKEATIGSTKFLDIDISSIKELETVVSSGPSFVDSLTFIKSKGDIPLEFLRRVGTPDDVIKKIIPIYKSAAGLKFYTSFISYSSKDHEFANKLYNDLHVANVQVWFAPEDLKIGDRFVSKIDQEIRQRDKLILVLSKNSIGSTWVEAEVETAISQEKSTGKNILFPIAIDKEFKKSDTWWAHEIQKKVNVGDFSDWKNHDSYTKSLNKLLSSLKEEP